MKIKATQSISVEFTAESEEIANEFFDYLNGEYDVDFEMEEQSDNRYLISALETADGWYSPGKMYLSNGDPGYPEEFEVDFTVCDDDLKAYGSEFCKRYEDNEEKFCFESVSCELVDDYDY